MGCGAAFGDSENGPRSSFPALSGASYREAGSPPCRNPNPLGNDQGLTDLQIFRIVDAFLVRVENRFPASR